MSEEFIDLINHPPHHRADSPYETTRVIEEWGLGYLLGNVLKYIARHELKGETLEDLKKARWYLNRRIALMEEQDDHNFEGGAEVSTSPKRDRP